MHGYVYVLTNRAMPGIVKIGYTDRNPDLRARELSSATGVPLPFEVHTWWKISGLDANEIEKSIHIKLHHHRVNGDREFFNISAVQVIVAVEEMFKELKLIESVDSFEVSSAEEEIARERNRLTEVRRIEDATKLKNEIRLREEVLRKWNANDAHALFCEMQTLAKSGVANVKFVNSAKYAAFSALTMGVGLLLAPAFKKQSAKDSQPVKWEAFRLYRERRMQYFISQGFISVPGDAIDHTAQDKNPFL